MTQDDRPNSSREGAEVGNEETTSSSEEPTHAPEPEADTRAFLDRRQAAATAGGVTDSREGAIDRDEDLAVSVTIEGTYDAVFDRLEHPQASKHGELDVIIRNIEETYLAVLKTGGGIRSEIYEAVEFELDQPWEIRIYLEVLAMHNLARLQDDRWVPTEANRTGPDR